MNLLVFLQALLEERSVTRAAQRVGITQSAMSHALGRLRELFSDPLLVRSSRRMVMTPRAEELAGPLREALGQLEAAIVTAPTFDPASATGLFSIACEDYVSSLLVPRLVRRLSVDAPGIDIDIQSRGRELSEQLEGGQVDIAIAVFFEPSSAMRQRLLFQENFACVVRRDHPVVRKRLTLKRYTELPHLLVGSGERGTGAVDVGLARIGEKRRVAARTPTFLSAPLIVAETDLLLTIPKRLAERFAAIYDLQVFKPPLVLADFQYHSRWHERWQNDDRHRWLRRVVSEESDAVGC
jgi:DNA-binding transcriptional LysR family regulator